MKEDEDVLLVAEVGGFACHVPFKSDITETFETSQHPSIKRIIHGHTSTRDSRPFLGSNIGIEA